MELSTRAQNDLAEHLTARFSAYADRAQLARLVGQADAQLTGTAGAVWAAIVAEAVRTDQIATLVRVASRLRPHDAQLEAMVRSLDRGHLVVPRPDRPADWLKWAVFAGVVVALLGVFAVIGDAWRGPVSSRSPDEVRGSSPAAEPAPPAEGAARGPIEAEDVVETDEAVASVERVEPVEANEPVEADEPAEADEPVEADEPAQAVEADEPVEADAPAEARAAPEPSTRPTGQARASSGSPPGGCEGPADQILGYAYAGESSPGRVGQVWTAPQTVNVRAEYPSLQNDFSPRTQVVCLLIQGSLVTLEHEPIQVPGDAYWVPIAGSSVRAAP